MKQVYKHIVVNMHAVIKYISAILTGITSSVVTATSLPLDPHYKHFTKFINDIAKRKAFRLKVALGDTETAPICNMLTLNEHACTTMKKIIGLFFPNATPLGMTYCRQFKFVCLNIRLRTVFFQSTQ